MHHPVRQHEYVRTQPRVFIECDVLELLLQRVPPARDSRPPPTETCNCKKSVRAAARGTTITISAQCSNVRRNEGSSLTVCQFCQRSGGWLHFAGSPFHPQSVSAAAQKAALSLAPRRFDHYKYEHVTNKERSGEYVNNAQQYDDICII